MPAIPPALFLQEDRDTFEICYDRERLSWTDEDGERRRYYAEERHVPSLRWAISKWRQHGTGRNVVDRAEEIIAALDPYMAAVKRAEDLSGVLAFHDESRRNQALIDDLVKQITALLVGPRSPPASRARFPHAPPPRGHTHPAR